MSRSKKKNNKNRTLPSQRQQRVGELLRHALSDKLMRGELPEPMLYDRAILVSEVSMTADLRLARVYITAFKNEEMADGQSTSNRIAADESDALLKALQGNAGLLQKSCAAPLGLKFTPRIVFVWDNLPERSANIDRLLRGKSGVGDGAGEILASSIDG